MPPKGKKGKGKSGKKKSKNKDEPTRPTEKESLLQAELDKKVQELAELKLRAYKAQEENDWLNEEAKRVRLQTGEYMHFMTKKTNRRQTQVVTLNDYHQKQIEDINHDKEKMLKEYQQKKDDLRVQLARKEELLLQAKRELEAMHDYKEIQQQQNEEIKRLQHEVTRLRGQHVNEMARIKYNYRKELQQQKVDQDAKVEEIQREANEAAEQYLYDQTLSIQDENVELRKHLQDILKQKKDLSDLKQRLEAEQLHLIRRLKLTTDLRKIRLDRISSDVSESSVKSTPH